MVSKLTANDSEDLMVCTTVLPRYNSLLASILSNIMMFDYKDIQRSNTKKNPLHLAGLEPISVYRTLYGH